MLRRSPKSLMVRVAVLGAVCACSSPDYSTSSNSTVVNGTITATLSNYGPWIGQRTVTATNTNGALIIVGEDVNFKKITLFLVGVDINAAQQNTPRTISITPVVSDTVGYAELRETFQTAVYVYNTFEGGHASVTLTHVSADRVAGTFDFLVQNWPTAAGQGSRSATGGAFDIRPTIGTSQ